jgi:hypothetical protein
MKFSPRSYTYAIEDTRHAQAAMCPKIHSSHHQILSCNMKKKISWSTIKITTIVLLLYATRVQVML